MDERLLQSIVDDYFPIGSRERGFTLELASESVELAGEGAFITLRLIIWDVYGECFHVNDVKEQRTRVLVSAQLQDVVAVREWLDEVVARAEELTRDEAALMMPDEFMGRAEPETVAGWSGPIAAPLSRDSILLCPKVGVADAGESKIGGDVLWPEGQDWPRCPSTTRRWCRWSSFDGRTCRSFRFRREPTSSSSCGVRRCTPECLRTGPRRTASSGATVLEATSFPGPARSRRRT
jgi:hypothetical protein